MAGLFEAGGGPGVLLGAELAEPQQPQAVDQSGSAVVTKAFGLSVTTGGTFVASSETRQYHPGPLDGQVWCQTFKHTLLASQTLYGCGCVDQWTVGTISANNHAIKDLGFTEATAAGPPVEMRADIETLR